MLYSLTAGNSLISLFSFGQDSGPNILIDQTGFLNKRLQLLPLISGVFLCETMILVGRSPLLMYWQATRACALQALAVILQMTSAIF